MFDILFGWRKASKCKRMIKRVQCRLKLLKNKRCSIARQLRKDVAHLLKYGHDQTAFNRVEQLFKDESIVAVYELLDHFCEFINIHLSYIRRHKDCPNDINEAVSSLIFASARCGDLPELPVIRKLFGERYGERFAKAALELLPGNLVNRQIRDNLSIKSVPAEVKYRLVDEIARSCLPIGPLALEYNFTELQQPPANKSNDDQIPNGDVRTSCNRYEESQSDPSNIIGAEGKIVHVDTSSEGNKISTLPNPSPITLESSVQERFKDGGMVEESPSESSIHMQEEMIYLDDIEEFQSPISKDGNDQDQRLFMFKSPVIPAREKIEGGYYKGSRRSRKSRKAAGKRLRNPSFSWETNRSVKDGECDKLWYENCKSPHPRKHQKKLQMEGSQISYCAVEILDHHCCKIGSSFNCEMMVNNCSLEHPCYVCVSDDKDGLRRSPWQPKRRSETLERFPSGDLKEETVQYGIYNCQCSSNGELKNQHPYLRAMTMPTERPKENDTDNILRSKSFPFREPNASSPHVHPKMPDYDELVAKFMALKRANLQNKHQ